MKNQPITIEEKGRMISNITSVLRSKAKESNKSFDAGSMFFNLIGKTDNELRKIYKLCNA